MNQSQASRASGRFLFLVWMGLRCVTNDGSSRSISEGRLRGTSVSTRRSGRATCDWRQHLILCRLWRGELRPVGGGRGGGPSSSSSSVQQLEPCAPAVFRLRQVTSDKRRQREAATTVLPNNRAERGASGVMSLSVFHQEEKKRNVFFFFYPQSV